MIGAAFTLLPLCAYSASAKSGEGREGNWRNSAQGAPAVEECRKRVAANPKDANAQNDLGWALRQNGDLPGAEKCLREAISLSPDMPQAHSNLAVVLQDKKEWAASLEEARKAVSLDPKQPIFMVVMGNALSHTGDVDGAMLAYQSALKIRPDYENAHYNLGRVLHENGKNIEAQKELSIALQLDPNDERVMALLDKLFPAH